MDTVITIIAIVCFAGLEYFFSKMGIHIFPDYGVKGYKRKNGTYVQGYRRKYKSR